MARKALDAYFTISAAVSPVRTMGAFSPEYAVSTRSPAFLSSLPITIRSGLIKSCIARPSRRNSGFMINPIFCFFRQLSFKTSGITTSCVVPGGTVLFVAITWYFSEPRRAWPIDILALFIMERSALPFEEDGVPTQIKVISDIKTLLKSELAFKLWLIFLASISSRPSSNIVGLTELMCATFPSSISIKFTECPSSARQTDETKPT